LLAALFHAFLGALLLLNSLKNLLGIFAQNGSKNSVNVLFLLLWQASEVEVTNKRQTWALPPLPPLPCAK
jgi:hypothetical protein